jgi:hypothetical protein
LTYTLQYNYNIYMKIIWDENKNQDNIRKHKISLFYGE